MDKTVLVQGPVQKERSDQKSIANLQLNNMPAYLESGYVPIRYDGNSHVIIHLWSFPDDPDDLRKVFDAETISAMQYFRAGKVISAPRLLGALRIGNREWYDKAVKAGFSHQSFIMQKDSSIQMSAEDIVDKIGSTVPGTNLSNLISAIQLIKVNTVYIS